MHAPPSIMLAIIWNCRGMGRPTAVRSLRAFVKSHKPSLLFLSELHISSPIKIQKLCLSLGFHHLEFVPALGRSGGLVLAWKDHLDFRLLTSNSSLISGLIFMPHLNTTWQVTGVYGPPTPSMRPMFWDQLMAIEKN